MKSKALIRIAVVFSIIFINTGCDQVTKKMIRDTVPANGIISVFNQHLVVTRVENSGAFLSIGNSLPKTTRNILLSLFPVLALVGALIFTLTQPTLSPALLTGICFMIGGGIGNIYDRIANGSVTDFLHLRWGGLQTGIFNMADVSIMTGVLIIVLNSFFKKTKTSELKTGSIHI